MIFETDRFNRSKARFIFFESETRFRFCIWRIFYAEPVSTSAENALIRVTLKPWRPVLPLRKTGVIIANRHLDLWQSLFVEDFVFRDHLVQEK